MARLHGVEPASEGTTEVADSLGPDDSPTGTVREKVMAAPVEDEDEKKVVELSPWGVLKALISLPRGVVAFCLFFVFGFIIGALDSTLTIRVETIWHKDSSYVGLIYLAGAAPAFFTGPLAGWLSDKYGTEWVIGGTLLLCLPWIPLMTRTDSLAGFIVYFAFTNIVATSLNAVASLEVAIVSKYREGISEIHEFAAMNLAFAVSSAVGAIAGGQIYNALSNGWEVVCWICFACFAVMIVPPLIWTGSWPLFWRVIGRPGPRSGRDPKELAKEDAEKARKDAENAQAEEMVALDAVPAVEPTAAGFEFEVIDKKTKRISDIPPVLPPVDAGHSASPKIPQS